MLSKLSITILIALFSSNYLEWLISALILSIPRAFLAQRHAKLVEAEAQHEDHCRGWKADYLTCPKIANGCWGLADAFQINRVWRRRLRPDYNNQVNRNPERAPD